MKKKHQIFVIISDGSKLYEISARKLLNDLSDGWKIISAVGVKDGVYYILREPEKEKHVRSFNNNKK